MLDKKHFARRVRGQRILQSSLAVGGAFNLGLGAALGLAPDATMGILELSRPTPGLYLQMLALLAGLLGCYYLLAASDIRRYSGVVALAIVGRSLAATVLALGVSTDPSLGGLKLLAIVDASFALVHAVSWWSIRP